MLKGRIGNLLAMEKYDLKSASYLPLDWVRVISLITFKTHSSSRFLAWNDRNVWIWEYKVRCLKDTYSLPIWDSLFGSVRVKKQNQKLSFRLARQNRDEIFGSIIQTSNFNAYTCILIFTSILVRIFLDGFYLSKSDSFLLLPLSYIKSTTLGI